MTAGETYEVSLLGGPSNPIEDPFLAVLDAFGSLVGFDDDGGPGLTPNLAFTAKFTEEHFLVVDTFDSSEFGSYALSLSIVTAPPPVPVGTFAQMAGNLTGNADKDLIYGGDDTLNGGIGDDPVLDDITISLWSTSAVLQVH